MTNITNEKSTGKLEILAVLATITAIITAIGFAYFGAIISHFLSELSRLTLIGITVFGVLAVVGFVGLLIYLGVNGAINTTKRGIETGYQFAFMNEQLNMAKANTAYRHAESRLVDSESIAKQYQILPISATKGALIMVNGVAQLIPPFEQSSAAMPLLAQGESDFEWDSGKLFDVFKTAKSVHGLLIGARHSGKSTLLNGLMNELFQGSLITLIDPLFNKVESGWLLPDNAKVSRDFVAGVIEFHASHKKSVDNSTTKRDKTRKILVIDECPSLLKRLKATDKKQYDFVMSMLREIYSQGSHTSHNLILLSQTVLSEDLDLSSNDKANFIQVVIGSLSGDYLALRRGKSNKKELYAKLSACANEFDYYVCFEDNKGIIDIQPLPDLSEFGAKRLYGMAANEVVEVESESMVEESIEPEPTTVKSIFDFEVIPESDMAIIQAANELKAANEFSLAKLHKKLTGKQIGGNQANTYKAILSKYGLLETVQK